MKKWEFSKLVLGAVMLLYFAGAVFAAVIVCEERSALGELLAYIGAPTATAIGFYAWKAKSENVIKITKDIEDIGTDEKENDEKISEKLKLQLISGIAKVISEIETEE